MPTPSRVPTRAQVRTIWAALLASVVVAAIASATLEPPNRFAVHLRGILLAIGAFLTLVELPMAYVLTAIMRRKALPGTPPDTLAATQTIVACGFAEGTALFAAVGRFATGEPLFFLFMAACAAVIVHWFPSDARWAWLGASVRPRALVRE
jgi:hypothetical protein